MVLNASKTQFIVFASRQNLKLMAPASAKIDHTTVSENQIVKNLGVIFDRHLSFDSHIDHLVKRCTGTLLSLCHAKHGLPPEVLPRLVDDRHVVITLLRVDVRGDQRPADPENSQVY